MPRARFLCVGLVVASLVSASDTPAPPAPAPVTPLARAPLLELSLKTREARLAGDQKAWLKYGEQTLALAPDHPDLLISVARALAAQGRTDEAARRLSEAVERGAGLDPFSLPEFANLKDNAQWQALAARALANQQPVPHAKVFVTLPRPDLRPEGITNDPESDRWFVGSQRGEIWQIDRRGRAQPFITGTGLREVLGLKVDAGRRRLWAVTGVFPDLLPAGGAPKPDVGVSGLHAYDLESGERVSHCELDERPTLHGLNDMAIAQNGDVYVTDSTAGAVYRVPSGACRFEVLHRGDDFTFPNGIVITPDGKRLYVAHIEGLSAIEIHANAATYTGKRTRLKVPANAAVNSIDGLAWDGTDLLGIQSSPYLARVARIRLAQGGLAVQEVSTVSSRTPPGLNPTTGVVVGRGFYIVAGLPNVMAPNTPPTEQPAQILRVSLQ
jgi:sugar lactone lactonase YvrE